MDVRSFFGRFASSVNVTVVGETFTFRVNGGPLVTVHGRENLSKEQRAVVEATDNLNESASELLKRVLKL